MATVLTDLDAGSDTLTPIPLMQLATAFWAFKTLAAAHELDLFTRISIAGGITALELAERCEIDPRPAEMLLTGCAALGLLEKRGTAYFNSPLAGKFLVHGAPYYFGGFVTMLDKRLYPGWDKLPLALRTNRPTTWDPSQQRSLFDAEDPAMLATFWGAMHSLSTFTARVLGQSVDFSAFTRLLDVGGGSAAFDIELCRQYPELRATVYDLIVGLGEWVVPVGRLDRETSGLLLLTNDTQFAERVTNPESHVRKTYRVTARPRLSDEALARLRAGVVLRDGPTRPATVRKLGDRGPCTAFEITITEGRNRQVRRMVQEVGARVDKLARISIGAVGLGDLAPGEVRRLTAPEVRALAGRALGRG